ncbi:MAG: hypothetical protein STSR0009_09000 [Methanoregula sp.]
MTIEKTGYTAVKVNITQYPAKGETVVMNVTFKKIAATTTTATTVVNMTAADVVKANATVPAARVTSVVRPLLPPPRNRPPQKQAPCRLSLLS